MPYFIRQIRKLFWVNEATDNTDIPADVLQDFGTKNNTISLWKIEDDKSNLCRIVVAISCNKPRIREFEYVIVNCECICGKGFNINKSPGTTPDRVANESWHYDVAGLTGDSLLEIAKLFHSKCEPITMETEDVLECLKECIDHINLKQVSQTDMKKYLKEFKESNVA